MNRGLLYLNGALLALTIYSALFSWTTIEVVFMILFGVSFALLIMQNSRIGNLLLFLSNSIVATFGILITLIATVGGLFTYGPGAIASLILLIPTAVFVANAIHGKSQLGISN